MLNINKNPGLFHNKDAYNDLSLKDSIFKAVNQTRTRIGEKKLQNRLKYCSFDTKHLENICNMNYAIQKDLVYRFDMEKYLTLIKNLEDTLDYWMINKCNNQLIFNWNIFNNRYILSMSNKFKMSSMFVMILVYLFVYLYMNYHGYNVSIITFTKGIVVGYYNFLKIMCMLVITNIDTIEWIALILTIIYICYQIYMTYQSVNTCYEHYSICNNFYTDYNNIKKFVDIVEDMTKIEHYIPIKHVIKSIKALKYYFTENVTLGFTLVTKMYVNDYANHIDVLANFVGRIDCNISNSILLDNGYVVPRFIDAKFPVLHIEGVWNPIIHHTKRVKNSLIMDVKNPNVLILTGPNKAGKSTFMRSIITSLYLAQSLGISCADRISLTPFRDIFTYLNVPDSIGRESLFEAELNRCYKYIDRTESFRGFSIGIIDELFTGTNPIEGEAASYAILKRISNNPHNITILSTHYHNVLNYLNSEKFSFNRFVADIDQGGKFKFSYKIQNGISNQCIALQLLKERGFNADIVNDAFTFMNKT